MTREVASYAPSLVEVSLFGVQMEGFSSESVVRITKEEVTTTLEIAQDGSSKATVNKHTPYRVTVSLQSTSSANSWLHLIYKLYERAGVEFKMPLSIKDKSGDTNFFCTDVFFETVPDKEFNSTISVSEWSFLCVAPSYTYGGNIEPNQIIETLQLLAGALEVANMFGINLSGFTDQLTSFQQGAVSKLKGMF